MYWNCRDLVHSWHLSHLAVLQLQPVLCTLLGYNFMNTYFSFVYKRIFSKKIGFGQRQTCFFCIYWQIGLATAIRYALTRRAFSLTANGPEILLLDYPSHQRRLIPLLAKTYLSFLLTSHGNTQFLRLSIGILPSL